MTDFDYGVVKQEETVDYMTRFNYQKLPLTKVFAIAGLDGRTIGSKTLISFSSRLDINN